MKAPAIIFSAPGQVGIQDIAMPDPGPGEVQIRTRFSSISSGTEGWALHNRFTWAPTIYPCVPGYQRVGTVSALGADVVGLQEGDTVMATSGCWKTTPVAFWGAHAAVGNTAVGNVYPLPEAVDPVDAAAMVVIQVGYNAAYRAALQPGDWVVVYGDGVIGQFGAQAARSRGARTILVGHRDERLAAAAQHSADHALHDGPDTVEQIRALTGDTHVPVIIDTVQQRSCQESYLPLLRQGKGQIVYSGFSPEEPWASMTALHKLELTTHYIQGIQRERMEATLALLAERKLAMAPLVTHRVAIDQAQAMYRMIDERSEPFLGILFEW
ncbi:MAG: zinc-binding dehydrogenase [bacterium]|nr:zinc-binding dehydrogenase [bacterium]